MRFTCYAASFQDSRQAICQPVHCSREARVDVQVLACSTAHMAARKRLHGHEQSHCHPYADTLHEGPWQEGHMALLFNCWEHFRALWIAQRPFIMGVSLHQLIH